VGGYGATQAPRGLVGSPSGPPSYSGGPSGPGYGTGPSGSFPAAGGSGSGGGGDNRTLWIVVGVVAVIAIILIGIAVSSGGGDESGGSTGDDPTTTTAGDEPTTTTTPDASLGYDNEELETSFVDSCSADGAATSAQCQCAYDGIAEQVPFEDFLEYGSSTLDDPSASIPDEIMTIMLDCITSA
jgi:hypothetical protein